MGIPPILFFEFKIFILVKINNNIQFIDGGLEFYNFIVESILSSAQDMYAPCECIMPSYSVLICEVI